MERRRIKEEKREGKRKREEIKGKLEGGGGG
jgi:hypothetical protein